MMQSPVCGIQDTDGAVHNRGNRPEIFDRIRQQPRSFPHALVLQA